MKTCEYGVYNPTIDEIEPCGNLCEGSTDMCASHNAFFRKLEKQNLKAQEKRNTLIAKQREKAKQPRKTISKNPADWKNTFLCSDGTRVTQAEINELRKEAYQLYDWQDPIEPKKRLNCEGCGILMLKTSHAHIIPQARCKVISKTELIWDWNNFFHSCDNCNLAIENPKAKAWKQLKNIEKCLSFIKQHDPELFMKFELSAVNQEQEPHKL